MKLKQTKEVLLSTQEMLVLKGGFNDSQRQATKDESDDNPPPPPPPDGN